jgi:hypothetical protein
VVLILEANKIVVPSPVGAIVAWVALLEAVLYALVFIKSIIVIIKFR